MIESKELVIIKDNTPLADSREIANQLNIDHQNFFAMIKKYQTEVEKDFGVIQIKTDLPPKGSKGGRPSKYALLTENQSYAYLTYSDNTKEARECKRKLVTNFATARQIIEKLLEKKKKPVPTKKEPELIGPPPIWLDYSPSLIAAEFAEKDMDDIANAQQWIFDYLLHRNEPLSYTQLRIIPALKAIPAGMMRYAVTDLAEAGDLETVKLKGKTIYYQVAEFRLPRGVTRDKSLMVVEETWEE